MDHPSVSLPPMSFFAILFALLIEQARPLARSNPIHAGLRAWALSVSRNFDTGKPQHGWLAWCLAVLVPAFATLAMHWLLLWGPGWPFAMLWSVEVLYVTLGLRQFSHHFTGIRVALEGGDENDARARLAHGQQVDVGLLPRREIVRHVIEYSVLAAHRHVFGVLAWFSVLAALGLGPTGAGLDRAAGGWGCDGQCFAKDNDGVVLAATAGAIDVRLGGAALKAHAGMRTSQGLEIDSDMDDSDATPGREPEVGHLRSVVGLVWRSVVVWMLLLALLTLARLLG